MKWKVYKPTFSYSCSPTQPLQSVQYKGFWLVSVMWFSIYVRFVSVLFCLHRLYFMISCTTDHTFWLLPVLQAIIQPTSSNILEVRCSNTWILIHALLGSFKNSAELWEVEPPRKASPDLHGGQQAIEVSLTVDCYVSPLAPTPLQNTVATAGLSIQWWRLHSILHIVFPTMTLTGEALLNC